MREAGKLCLACRLSILETVGGEILAERFMDRWDSSREVCCIKLDQANVINREFIGAKVDAWGV